MTVWLVPVCSFLSRARRKVGRALDWTEGGGVWAAAVVRRVWVRTGRLWEWGCFLRQAHSWSSAPPPCYHTQEVRERERESNAEELQESCRWFTLGVSFCKSRTGSVNFHDWLGGARGGGYGFGWQVRVSGFKRSTGPWRGLARLTLMLCSAHVMLVVDILWPHPSVSHT